MAIKVRDAIKIIEEDGWELVRQEGATGNISILRS